jgi:catalase
MTRIFTALMLSVAMTGVATADDVSPEKLVDSLNGVFGKHANARASHAKGVCVKGSFTPAADASTLSKVPFLAAPVPVLGRFSFGGGNPKASDKAKSPRGLALRLDPDGKAPTDFVFLSAPIFFARTPEEVVGFLEARFPGPDGKPDPAKVKAFTEAHPWTAKQGAWVASKPIPASYAGLPYFSIHAFEATAADGKKTTVKLKFEPVAGEGRGLLHRRNRRALQERTGGLQLRRHRRHRGRSDRRPHGRMAGSRPPEDCARHTFDCRPGK